MEVKPISPKALTEARKKPDFFPPEVIEAFNELITKNFNGGEAHVGQDEVCRLARSKMAKRGRKVSSDEIFDNGWMDIEPLFRANGWKVEYDKPGYNESYEAFFVFTPKGKK
jgi:hypothetical protein